MWLTLSNFGDTIDDRFCLKRGFITLDSITVLIRNEIKKQYGSVRKFSETSGIPYSTLSNALAKGVGGTSYDTVVKICRMLDIKQAYDSDLVLFNSEFHDIYSKLTQLDEQGVHTVCTVLNVEYNRCIDESDKNSVRAFNGIGYVSKSENAFDPERIKQLIKRAKQNGRD